MKISSPAFLDNTPIPAKYTCDGEGINPPLEFEAVPAAAQSLALIVADPDAPAGTWFHWLMWNIPPETRGIGENSAPVGAGLGQTSFNTAGYGGPCPPSGTHHYSFQLFALDTKLDLPTSTQAAGLQQAMIGHILAQATLTGLYRRQ